MIYRLFFIFFLIFLTSCGKEKPLYEPRVKDNGFEVYQQAYLAFENGDLFFAQKKFYEAE